MKLTKRGEYALRTLIRLGICHSRGETAVPVSTLASEEQVPFKFTENILASLRLAGYVKTVRGKDGGTCLARAMDSIVLGDVVRLIEGDLAPVDCVSDTHLPPCTCPCKESCGLRIIMQEVHALVTTILDNHTLDQLVGAVLRKHTRQQRPEEHDAGDLRHSNPGEGLLSLLGQQPPFGDP